MEPLQHTEPQINRGYRLQFQFVHITAPKRALDGRQKAGLALGKPRCQSRPLRASTQRQGCSPACSQTDRHRSLKPSPAGAAQEQPKLVAPLPAPSQKSLSRAPAHLLGTTRTFRLSRPTAAPHGCPGSASGPSQGHHFHAAVARAPALNGQRSRIGSDFSRTSIFILCF